MTLVQVGISIYGQDLFQVQSCIESCLTQENSLITCRTDGPDACDDGVLRYLKSVSDREDMVRLIIGSKRLGSYGSLNSIFETSESPFLCQLDADDMLAPGALRLCIEQLEANLCASFLYTDCLEVDEQGSPIQIGGRSQHEYTEINSLIQFIPFHLRMIRRRCFNQIGGYDASLRYTGDYDISLKLTEVGSVIYLNRPLYSYRIHSRNTSFANFQKLNSEVFSICNEALVRRGLTGKYRLVQGDKGEMTIIDL